MRTKRPRRRTRCKRLRGDRGVASVEFAVLAVVILALTFTAIQVGFYYHARKVAQSAARHAVDAGRIQGATPADGAAQAREFLAHYGDSVRGYRISTAGTTAQTLRITITGHVATLVPGLELDISQHAQAPIERWTTP